MINLAPNIFPYCASKNTIVVCGYTKTGKISIARQLADRLSYSLFVSDDYIIGKFDKSLEYFYEDIQKAYNKVPIIVEGVLCFRLLRDKFPQFNPDLIIKTKCNEATIKYCYEKDGESDKIPRALTFNKGLNTIWEEYLQLQYSQPRVRKPEFLEINTSFK